MVQSSLQQTRSRSRARLLLAVPWTMGVLSLLVGGCSNQASGRGEWPDSVQQAPVVVRQAYAFAEEHPEVLQHVPCYCGCGSIGHTSNYDCFFAGEDVDGNPIYDEHALGCSICVDIALDAQRLFEDGRSLDEIRAWIDLTYSPYGPSNMP